MNRFCRLCFGAKGWEWVRADGDTLEWVACPVCQDTQ